MLGLNGEKEVKKNRKIPKGVTWSSKSKDRQYNCQTNQGKMTRRKLSTKQHYTELKTNIEQRETH
jgi:hypothetical protein